MDALEATLAAEHLESQVGLAGDKAWVECYAVPLRRGASRRLARWTFLVVTDVDEDRARDALSGYHVEFLDRRGPLKVLLAWPAADR